jgi:uncharacterized protein YkwD
MRALAGLLLSGFLVFAFLDSAVAEGAYAEALSRINNFRTLHGQPSLEADHRLDLAARRHAQAMAEDDFFSHTGADGSRIGQRVSKAGYKWRLVAENLAAGMADGEAVVLQWIDSPGHRQNLLMAGLRHVGLAHVRRDPDPGKVTFRDYWVLVLAAPAAR